MDIQDFSGQLKEYKTSKGTIQLPYSRPVPVELISDIVKCCSTGVDGCLEQANLVIPHKSFLIDVMHG